MRIYAFLMAAALAVTTCFSPVSAAYKEEAASRTEDILLDEGEELEEVSMDGVFSQGGLDFVASDEYADEVTETYAPSNYNVEADTYSTPEETIAAALNEFQRVVEFPTGSEAPYTLKKDDFQDFYTNFANAHPEFFYVDTVSYISSAGNVVRLVFTFTDTVQNLQKMRGELDSYVAEVKAKFGDSGLSKAEQAVLVHDFLADRVKYVEGAKNQYNAYGALVSGEAVCQGYALAYQLLLNALGITCITVGSDDMNHAWNMVYIDGHYYHVDVTWDDSKARPGQMFHNYLLLSKSKIEQDHTGYAVDTVIRDSTNTDYDNSYWKNIYSMIYYYNGALYYLFPTVPEWLDSSDMYRAENMSFCKKPVGKERIDVLRYDYAIIAISDAAIMASSEKAEARMKSLYYSIQKMPRLVETADAWYFNSAYNIYKVDKSAVAAAVPGKTGLGNTVYTKDLVDKVSVMSLVEPKGEYLEYGLTGNPKQPLIDGLSKQRSSLLYATTDSGLKEVPDEVINEDAPSSLYLYHAGEVVTIPLKSQYPLCATIFPRTAAQDIVYEVKETSPTNPYIDVDANGLVTAKGETTSPVEIVVSSSDGKLKQSIKFVVEIGEVKDFLLSNQSTTLKLGATKQLVYSVVPANAVSYTLSFASENTAVATVNASTGLITAVGPGKAVIKATLFVRNPETNKIIKSISKTCTVTVIVPPTQVILSKSEMELNAGETGELTWTLMPDNVTEKGVAFSSSDNAVATVDNSGSVSAVAAGTAVITVASTYDKSVKAVCTVTVKAAESQSPEQPDTPTPEQPEENVAVTGVKLSNQNEKLGLYSELLLTATVLPEKATNRKVLWTCSNKDVIQLVVNKENPLQMTAKATGIGTATVKVTTLEGAHVASCKITVTKGDVTTAVVSKISNKEYTGKAYKPSPTLKIGESKLAKNRDYTLSYKNNKKIGTATVTITGKGNFTGTRVVTFKIIPKSPTLRLTRKTKTALRFTYGYISAASGYQLQYATDKKFAKGIVSIDIKQNKRCSYTISRLKSKKTYYVRIRSFKKVGTKKYYSKYTKLGPIKTK